LERLTIDTTVARDLLDPDRPRHSVAQKIAGMAEAGAVEIAVAPQGHRFDYKPDLVQALQGAFPRARIIELPQLAYLSEETYPSETLYPGNYDLDFGKALRDVSTSWDSDRHGKGPPEEKDAWHLETHVTEKRDVFITDDRGVLNAVERLNTEHGYTINAMRLEEYVRSRES
jgi:hypothetical protein